MARRISGTQFRPLLSQEQQIPPTRQGRRLLREAGDWTNNTTTAEQQFNRVLYIVTSLAEFDNGRRATERGYDRFSNTLIPVLYESVTAMQASGYSVDVYLITHYNVSNDRRLQVRNILPSTVGLEIWDDATPLGYALERSEKTSIEPITRSLARQHRFVIKDKFLHYDIFCNFEDDMIIKGDHVAHFVSLTQQLYEMRSMAPKRLFSIPKERQVTTDTSGKFIPSPETIKAKQRFFGEMTNTQLARMIPGFVRVEAALPGYKRNGENRYPQIPVNRIWNDTIPNGQVNASICCHVSSQSANDHIPKSPTENDLYFWETSIDALGVRELPNGDWVVTQAGNQDDFYPDPNYVIGDYWVGRDTGYFLDKPRPDPTQGRYANNQGGWMATRRQISDWHRRWCRGGFLPPYDPPIFEYDGLDARTVEYWSGGIQIAGVLACNLKRILSLDPDGFSKHLLYHASNNKQRQKNIQYRFSSHTIQEFWGQLNEVRKIAELAKAKAKALSKEKGRV